MNLSYWEIKNWIEGNDFTIVGSGIVGLNCALHLKERFPDSKVLILEKGILPQGASTKNAGFACFGSLSELIYDCKLNGEVAMVELVKKRVTGLQILRKTLGDDQIGFQQFGGYELFTVGGEKNYDECLALRNKINDLLFPLFGKNVFSVVVNQFGFQNIKNKLIFNEFEAQIESGEMMQQLLIKAVSKGVKILNSIEVKNFSEYENGVAVETSNFELKTKKLLFATNGFSKMFLNEEVQPARAQVLITKPIPDLKIKGIFHLDQGYYYFRNIDNRILFGGGRNLDFSREQTIEFGLTDLVQNELDRLLKEVILPDDEVEIEHRWSGIMGVGNDKAPIVKQVSERIFCGIRLGGMGIAIGSLIGKELADLA